MVVEKRLRLASTDAERRLWSHLRSAQLGHKFRRQHELLGYVVDFVCIDKRVIVEVDGGQHAEQLQYDETRTAKLEALGFRVLRFWNNDVLGRIDDVLASIDAALRQAQPPRPSPLPRLRRGRGSRATSAASAPQHPGKQESLAGEDRSYSALDAAPSPLPQAQLGGEGWVRGQRDALRAALELRSRLYAVIRQFFAERNVLEVETPILSAAANTDPNIESFATAYDGHVDGGPRGRCLRTSSEFAQKRLLAAGVGDCYELGRVFRNGEAGRRHNPEFSMLEWYRVGWDHRRLADEVVELVSAALQLVGRAAEGESTSYRALFVDAIGVDPLAAGDSDLVSALAGIDVRADDLSRDDRLDLLLTHRIQPAFPPQRITVVYDYPATQCALAKVRAGDPPVAERFEIYLGSHELANGYHELTDATEQRARFEQDNARRRARSLAPLPIDERLLAALERGLPACAGVALGIERLLMAMCGSDEIADVLAFAFADA
jgi:lysyl-tRNA synthetase class 2